MKKLHWGHWILIFFIFYIAALGVVMYKSTQVNHNLVVEDYYAHDLAYQVKYDKIENAVRDKKSVEVRWDSNSQNVYVVFDSKNNKKGTITLYNPSNKFKDKKMPFHNIANDTIVFKDIILSGGKWKVFSDWSENGIDYYLQDEIYIPIN